MDFHEHILFQSRIWPDRPAIVLSDRVVTYGMLGQGVRGVARSLTAAGIRRGDVVGILIETPSWNLILSVALAHVGAVGCALSVAEHVDAIGLPFAAVVAQADIARKTRHRVLVMNERWFDLAPETRPHRFAETGEPIRIVVSSGTTGLPKPLVFEARAFRERLEARKFSVGHAPVERLMIMVGLSTSLGLVYAFDALACGMTLVVPPDAAEAVRMITLYAVDGVVASTRAAELLVEQLGRRPTPLLSLRMFSFGGGLPSPALGEAIMARLCPSAICIYGSTEVGVVASGPLDRLRVPGAVGFVSSMADCEIVDEAQRPVPPGTEGLVRARSPGGSRPWSDADPAAFGFDADGWHYPGDVGRIERNGLLVLTGRADHLINFGGVKTAPELIEQAFAGAPGILDIAVVSRSTAEGRVEILGLVVPGPDYAPAVLAAWAARQVVRVRIDRFVTVARLPRNETGKLARAEIRDLAEGLARG